MTFYLVISTFYLIIMTFYLIISTFYLIIMTYNGDFIYLFIFNWLIFFFYGREWASIRTALNEMEERDIIRKSHSEYVESFRILKNNLLMVSPWLILTLTSLSSLLSMLLLMALGLSCHKWHLVRQLQGLLPLQDIDPFSKELCRTQAGIPGTEMGCMWQIQPLA